ncbi:helix-turn-helix domain-containing protein [Streptomyces monticola]|uniref:Helix-turn-helix domain-containing protein n=1 Tax=Streptomyces monticola TaxID=2666263 RepID=A0ABW2JR02_9ACTN
MARATGADGTPGGERGAQGGQRGAQVGQRGAPGGELWGAAGGGRVESIRTVEELAALLRQLRRRAARRIGDAPLTYRQLSAKTGWAHGVIGDYFAGKTLPPTDRFDALVQLLGATGQEVGALATARDRVEEARRRRVTDASGPGHGHPHHDSAQQEHPRHALPSARTGVQARPPVPHQLPAGLPELAGRAWELAALDALRPSTSPAPPLIAALDGPAGIGKSALAVHAAHRLAPHFPDGQLYADLHGARSGAQPLPPLVVLTRFLRALGADTARPAGVEEAAAWYRALVTGRRLLVVLDNARDTTQILPLLPAGSGCAVLVTSRSVLATLNGAVHLHLPLLTPEASSALLGTWTGPERLAADRSAAAAIARHCGHLPLALHIAGARLAARPRWPVRALADRLADPGRRLDELRCGDLDMRAALRAGHQALLDRGHPGRAAARTLPLLASVQGELTLHDAMNRTGGALPETETEAALEELVDVQLLDSPAPERYRFHPLTRLFARETGHETGG